MNDEYNSDDGVCSPPNSDFSEGEITEDSPCSDIESKHHPYTHEILEELISVPPPERTWFSDWDDVKQYINSYDERTG